MNICVLGDSVARGIVYDENKQKYVFSQNGFLTILSREENINIKNLAKFGCTTAKAAKIVDSAKYDFANAQYTLIELGGNDCDYDWAKVAKEPHHPHLPNVPPDDFRKLYDTIIQKIKRMGSNPILLSLPPLDARAFFRWVSKGLDKDNILRFLNDVEHIYRWHESYNAMLFTIAKDNCVPIVDIRKAFLKEGDYKNYLCIDGMHPNEKGHQLMLKACKESLC